MSVIFSVVRFNHSQQLNLWEASDDATQLLLRADALPRHFHSYELVEFVSTGWVSGARTRVKKLSPYKALAYLNKLHAGGWITDTEYDRVYGATYRLLVWKRLDRYTTPRSIECRNASVPFTNVGGFLPDDFFATHGLPASKIED